MQQRKEASESKANIPDVASSGSGSARDTFLSKVQENQIVLEAKSQQRVQRAADWASKEVRKLIDLMRSLADSGHQAEIPAGASAVCAVRFATLFAAAASHMEALAGTLKIARKYGVVSYGPEALFERQHDDEVICLLLDVVPDLSAEDRPVAAAHVLHRAATGGFKAIDETAVDKCINCTKRVYKLERIAAGKLIFHNTCFRCVDCNKKLDVKNYGMTGNRVFCKGCVVIELNKIPSERRPDFVPEEM